MSFREMSMRAGDVRESVREFPEPVGGVPDSLRESSFRSGDSVNGCMDQSVTAPRLLDDTSFSYFAATPLRSLTFGGRHSARRFASSSSGK